jgi:hypothetical protein
VQEDDLGGGPGFGAGVVCGPCLTTQRAAELVLGGARVENVGQAAGSADARGEPNYVGIGPSG